jgi:hypothetical protein
MYIRIYVCIYVFMYVYTYVLRRQALYILTTSYNMNFFDLNDDVKSIISKYLLSDFEIRTMFSQNIKIFKKYYSERLYLMMIFVQF